MAESQGGHRQELEKAVVNGNIAAEKRGQILAFILGLVGIGGGIGLVAFGRDVQGLIALVSSLGALAGIFVYGRSKQTKERADKAKPK